MKVYVVNLGLDFEGEETEAVFSTRAKAEVFAHRERAKRYYEYFRIYDFEVDEKLPS